MNLRITGYADVDPRTLAANPRNYRVHNIDQQIFMQALLTEVGWVSEIMVNTRTGLVIDGHLRLKLALESELETVPVRYVDLDEAEEALALATFDPTGAMATTDREALSDLLKDVDSDSGDVRAFLSRAASANGIDDPFPEPVQAAQAQPGPAPPATEVEEESVAVVVGDVQFEVSKAEYAAWLVKLLAQVRQKNVVPELLRRLQLVP